MTTSMRFKVNIIIVTLALIRFLPVKTFVTDHQINTRARSRQVRYHFHPQYYVVGTGFRKPEKTYASIDKSNQMQPKFVKNTVFFLHGIGRRNINKRSDHILEKRSFHTKQGTQKQKRNFQKRGSQLDALRLLLKNNNLKSRIGPRF